MPTLLKRSDTALVALNTSNSSLNDPLGSKLHKTVTNSLNFEESERKFDSFADDRSSVYIQSINESYAKDKQLNLRLANAKRYLSNSRQNFDFSSDSHFRLNPEKLYKESSYENVLNKYHLNDSEGYSVYPRKNQTEAISEKQSSVESQRGQNSPKVKTAQYSPNLKSQLNEEDFERAEILHCLPQETQLQQMQSQLDTNTRLLFVQQNQLIEMNRALLVDMELKQVRKNIIKTELQTNNLKIGLRKSPSTKHINFSLDLKMNRKTYLKMPKVVDNSLRETLRILSREVEKAREEFQAREKQIELLNFYLGEFSAKVNRAFIYQQYLLQEEAKSTKGNKSSLTNSKSNQSLKKTKSQTKRFGKNKLNHDSPQSKKYKNSSNSEQTESVTSLQYILCRERKSKLSPLKDSKQQLRSKYLQEGQDSGKRYAQAIGGTQEYGWNLNSFNRKKKHFYYQCQQYLRELDEDYFKRYSHQSKLHSASYQSQLILSRRKDYLSEELLQVGVDIDKKVNSIKQENLILEKEIKFYSEAIHNDLNKTANQPNKKLKVRQKASPIIVTPNRKSDAQRFNEILCSVKQMTATTTHLKSQQKQQGLRSDSTQQIIRNRPKSLNRLKSSKSLRNSQSQIPKESSQRLLKRFHKSSHQETPKEQSQDLNLTIKQTAVKTRNSNQISMQYFNSQTEY